MGEGKSIDDILASIMEGKSDQPEIFETLKSEAAHHTSRKDLVAGGTPMEAPAPPAPVQEEPEQQFLCPVCDTPVRPNEKVCPGCGAEFSEGEATEYECPMCKAAVPADAARCPSCGVQFASEEEGEVPSTPRAEGPTSPAAASGPTIGATAAPAIPAAASAPLSFRIGPTVEALRDEVRTRALDLPFGDRKLIARELPKLVNEVKPLLVSAKNIGVGIDEGKRLINSAIEAGKRKDMDKAVRLISDARRALDFAFVTYIGGRLEALATDVDASGPGDAATLVRPRLEEVLGRLTQLDYDGAWGALQKAKFEFQSQAKEYTEGRKLLEATERLMGEMRAVGMDTREVDSLVRESRDAAQRRNLPVSLRLAKQAHERMLQTVPDFVQSEMRHARDELLDVKMRGGDLSKPVGFLKEASGYVKRGEWGEAIRFLKEFRKEISRAAKA